MRIKAFSLLFFLVTAGSASGQQFDDGEVITTFAKSTRTLAAADIDLDGDLDVLTAVPSAGLVLLIENLGGGNFAAGRAVNIPPLRGLVSVGTADLDGDGDEDLITASNIDQAIAWYANDGSGIFGPPVVLNGQRIGIALFEVCDLGQDGDLDIVSASYGGTLLLHENQGGGQFVRENRIETFFGGILALDIEDVNGDSNLDVVVSNFDAVYFVPNGGTGWGNKIRVSGTTDASRSPDNGVSGDIDGDGDSDILWVNTAAAWSPGIYWVENLGAGVFGPAVQVEGTSCHDLALVDLDQDSDLDIFVSRNTSQGIAWIENLGGGSFSDSQELGDGIQYPTTLCVSDVNQDGLLDALVADRVTGTVTFFEQSSGGLGYSITNFVAGGTATFEVSGAQPGDSVLIGYSLRGPGPTGTPYGMVDMSPPIELLASVFADSNGVASHAQVLPPKAAGIMVYTQAASGGELSNSLALQIQ
ncbi:MAG: VCBS repeat-containing protein [Planctomycetes bacterium]|nr:VCBS repeat-containing protein [Planctomycetota bacterium]